MKEFKIEPTWRQFPIFAAAGSSTFKRGLDPDGTDLRIINESAAAISQMAGIEARVENTPAINFQRILGRNADLRLFYEQPKPAISIYDCTLAAQDIRALRQPSYTAPGTHKTRDMLINLSYNELHANEDEAIRQLATDPLIWYGVEISALTYPEIVEAEEHITRIQKEFPKVKVWLKLPWPSITEQTIPSKFTAPDAIVLGHGIYSVRETLQPYDITSPTYETGSHLLPHHKAVLQHVLQHKLTCPLIVSGGIRRSDEIIELLNFNGVVGVQLCASPINNPLNFVSIFRIMRKARRRRN